MVYEDTEGKTYDDTKLIWPQLVALIYAPLAT